MDDLRLVYQVYDRVAYSTNETQIILKVRSQLTPPIWILYPAIGL